MKGMNRTDKDRYGMALKRLERLYRLVIVNGGTHISSGISIWKNNWHSPEELKVLFPEARHLSRDIADLTVEDPEGKDSYSRTTMLLEYHCPFRKKIVQGRVYQKVTNIFQDEQFILLNEEELKLLGMVADSLDVFYAAGGDSNIVGTPWMETGILPVAYDNVFFMNQEQLLERL